MDQPLRDFVSVVENSKDIGLIIAQDDAQAGDFEIALGESGFFNAKTVSDLFDNPKKFFSIKEIPDKMIYDFLVQYPSGQIQVFDSKEIKSRVISPDYQNSAFILVLTKENLKKITAAGYDILSVTGPAYQE